MVTTPLWPASSSSEALSLSLSPSQGPEAGGSVEGERLFQVEGAPVPERRRARLLVAYVGTGFHGFARQRGVTTVASALVSALERVVRHPVELTCAGRTDAGVHAWGQVVSLDLVASADLERVQRSVNKMLAPAVVVREIEWAASGFNARHSALSRGYRYSISCSLWADPFAAATTWHVGVDLDVRGMQAACDPLLGVHDFTSFCHVPRDRPGPLVRRVLSAEWSNLGQGYLRFEIEAASFCHQMVRSIVGLMVEVGLGRRKAGEVAAVVAARDRSAAGPLAPAHGLCLWEVKYAS